MFLQGFILGFSIAAPVGPIGLLCIQRTLQRGRLNGFVSGLGAATADMIYGLVAALGLTSLSAFLLGARFWIQLAGALFLVGLGVRTLVQRDADVAATDRRPVGGLASAYFSILALTLANPATIISFLAIFARFGLNARGADVPATLALVAGVFSGSAAWWLTLSSLTGHFLSRLGATGRRWITRAAGVCLVGVGIWALAGLRTS